MYKKAIIITFFGISLLLMGMMFLIVDVRNNPVLDDHVIQTEVKSLSVKEEEKAIVSFDKTKFENAELEAFNAITEDILTHIKKLQNSLFPNGISEEGALKTARVAENNTLFFKENDAYTKEAIQLLSKLDAFEDNIRLLQQKFPVLKNMKVEVRDKNTKGVSWLTYNFKDFPAVASYTKLKLLEETIQTKRTTIFTTILNP